MQSLTFLTKLIGLAKHTCIQITCGTFNEKIVTFSDKEIKLETTENELI